MPTAPSRSSQLPHFQIHSAVYVVSICTQLWSLMALIPFESEALETNNKNLHDFCAITAIIDVIQG